MRSIIADIVAAAGRAPEAIALRGEGGDVTYRQLVARTGRLAETLRARGITRESRVAIHLRRSPDLIFALLATVACGAAYVPLDPEHAESRLSAILHDADVALILGTRDSTTLADDTALMTIEEESQDAPLVWSEPGPRDAVYVLYTSGSTGAPKGVVVEYAALMNYLDWCLKALPATGGGAPLFATVAFDHAVTILYPPLMRGEPLKLLPPIEGGRALASGLLDGSRYSFVKITPSHLQLLSVEQRAELGRSADLVMFGGERGSGSLVADVRRDAPGLHVMNHYGPTEATVGCCVYPVPRGFAGSVLPIGRPIPGMRVSIRDEAGKPVADGTEGELFLGGVGLAREYWRRPDLTARAFVLEATGERWYRSGDLVTRDAEGVLHFHGRRDDQVKILGHRIELGEVEHVLHSISGIREAAVVTHDRDGRAELIAAVVPREADEKALRDALHARLPAAMVPTRIVFVDALPVTAMGKLDRNAIVRAAESPEPRVNDNGAVAAQMLARWQSLLGNDRITSDDDFFLVGGSSLDAVEIITWSSETFGVSLDLATLFELPTVRLLAGKIEELQRG